MASDVAHDPVLPRTDFAATTADAWSGRLYPCGRLWSGSALRDAPLDETPLKEVDWSTLFAYMHRRFGPPHIGSDDYKDLSAGWMLTTPDPYVFVGISPALAGPGFSFLPYLAAAGTARVNDARDLNIPAERAGAIRQAYKDTLIDLLRPVCVRDQYINALGEVGEEPSGEALLAYDEGKGDHIYAAPRHPSSGYAMPLGLFGGDGWVTMCTLIRQLGSGDMVAGRSALNVLLQQPTIDEAATAPWPVHRLMLWGAWKDRNDLAQRLRLSPDAIGRFDAEMAVLNAKKNRDTSIVDEMTDEAVAAADGYLSRLGLGGHDLAGLVNRYRCEKAGAEIWVDLVAVANEDFPDDSLPENFDTLGAALPDALRAGLAACGRQDLVAWVDRAAGKPGGLGALFQIVWHLDHKAKQEKKSRGGDNA